MFTKLLADLKDKRTSHETTVEASKSAYQHRSNNAKFGTLDERNRDLPRGLTHSSCPPPAFPLFNIGLRQGAPSPANIRHHESKASLLGGQPFNSSPQPFAASYHESGRYRPIGRRAAAKGASEMYKPNSLWTWSFLGVTFLQSAIILGFEAYVFALFEQSLRVDATQDVNTRTYTRTIPTFLTLYIFGSFYQLVLVWDALRLKNTIQVIGLCLYNVALLIYASVQGDQIKTATDVIASRGLSSNPAIWSEMRPYLIVIPCVLALGTVLMSFVAWKLYEEFAWTIYKQISADLRMKRRYLTFQIYIALLKFDFFLFLGFTIQFLVIVVDRTDVEFGLTIAAVPITILILVLAAYWTRKENKLGMSAIIFLYFAALAYFVFKLARIYTPPKAPTYAPVKKSLTTFAVITIILIILTITNAIACTLNFNKGLKPHIATHKVENEDEKAYMTEMPNLSHGPVPSRMTID